MNGGQSPLAGDHPPGLGEDDPLGLRAKTLASPGFRAPGKATGLNHEFFDAFARIAGDPDTDIGERARAGAPLGAARPVTSRG
eukprot:3714232-Alexandrium_andersonii.AAC.1